MNQRLTEWAWQQICDGDVSKRLIILSIAHFANELGVTEATHQDVMVWASLDADEYQQCLLYLQAKGLLTVSPAGNGGYEFILSGDKEKVL